MSQSNGKQLKIAGLLWSIWQGIVSWIRGAYIVVPYSLVKYFPFVAKMVKWKHYNYQQKLTDRFINKFTSWMLNEYRMFKQVDNE
ncbi:hypothetical protein MASR2M36_36200 [Providencia sp.]